MAKTVYDEWYGELLVEQRAAYRKYNVSPADHDDLVERYDGNRDKITAAVVALSAEGMYRPPFGGHPWPEV